MLEKINTLEKARNKRWKYTLEEISKRPHIEQYHLGNFYLKGDSVGHDGDKEVLQYVFEQLPPIRLVPWKDMKKLIDDGTCMTYGQLHHNALQYLRYLHEGWTAEIRPDHPIGGGAMDFKNTDGEYQKLSTVSNDPECNELNDEEENSLCSIYYHAAKAHWIINSIQTEGLRHPIQGMSVYRNTDSTNSFKVMIHPGSIRSKVFETMDEPEFGTIVTDYANLFPHIEPMSAEDMLDFWKGIGQDTVSAVWTSDGKLEFSGSQTGGIDFRTEVHEFSKNITQLAAKKPINIYLGYDSSHSEIFDIAEASIHKSVEKHVDKMGYCHEFFHDYKVEVKKLDIAEIDVYNREYANQSTEFTYSRFLIPYLENYEGFSFFIDDDYLWQWNPLSLFYFLDPKNALACVQYDFNTHDDTKFNGEKNVSYPKKLWSSMMIFNNGHEDCRKLTPEVVNTESGKYLHQFEWTDMISKIPHDKIATEGYETEVKQSHHAVHYTRGGPWIKGMDCEHINMLDFYRRIKNSVAK